MTLSADRLPRQEFLRIDAKELLTGKAISREGHGQLVASAYAIGTLWR